MPSAWSWLTARGGGASGQELLEHGLSRTDIARLVRQGHLLRVGRGRFQLPVARDLDFWEQCRREHLHRAAAAAGDGVLGLRSAALAWQLPVSAIPRLPEIIRHPKAARLAATRTVRTPLAPRDVVSRGTIRLTTVERTAVDVALDLPIPAALVTVDAALRRGASREVMLALLDTRGSARGCRRARQTLVWADPHSESPLESQGRGELLLRGVPRPECNVSLILDGTEARVDDWWDHLGIAAEGDGRMKYALTGSRKDALWHEKLRQEWLESQLGVLVLRFTDSERRQRPQAMAERWRRLALRREQQPWTPPGGLVVVQRVPGQGTPGRPCAD